MRETATGLPKLEDVLESPQTLAVAIFRLSRHTFEEYGETQQSLERRGDLMTPYAWLTELEMKEHMPKEKLDA